MTPLLYHRDDEGGFLLVAANGTADWNPDWFHNLLADAHVSVEVAGVQIAARAVVLDDDERATEWGHALQVFPGLGEAQARTAREIPLIRVVPC